MQGSHQRSTHRVSWFEEKKWSAALDGMRKNLFYLFYLLLSLHGIFFAGCLFSCFVCFVCFVCHGEISQTTHSQSHVWYHRKALGKEGCTGFVLWHCNL